VTDEFVFVYGTLRKWSRSGKPNRHPMHQALTKSADYLCDGHCPGRLYLIRHYPGLTSDPSGKQRVQGEIYRVRHPQKLWPILDTFENFNPAEPEKSDYLRMKTTVITPEYGEVSCWVYVYNHGVQGLRLIPSGDYCAR